MNRNAAVLAFYTIIIVTVGLAFGWPWAMIPVGFLIVGTLLANVT